MRTNLNDMLSDLVDQVPEWREILAPSDVAMVELRLNGATLAELAAAFGLTRQGVRFRLYGKGNGLKRQGGVAGRLRGRFIRRAKERAAAQREAARAV